MERTVFNPAQMKILRMMSFINTPKELESLENVISQYFAKKVDVDIDALCESGDITLDTIEEWGKEHLRNRNFDTKDKCGDCLQCCFGNSQQNKRGVCNAIL